MEGKGGAGPLHGRLRPPQEAGRRVQRGLPSRLPAVDTPTTLPVRAGGPPALHDLPDGRPKLLVACFRDTWSARPETGREGYRHEIHAIRLDGVDVFDPRTYGVARDIAVSAERGRVDKWYDVSEAARLMLPARIVMDPQLRW